MEIGLISDTHGFLDPHVFALFEGCDEIWHAGDFGSLDVVSDLQAFKPLRGVHGNIDDESVRACMPEDARFEVAGIDVWITHIAGRPGRYDGRVAAVLKTNPPQVLICGHSHILHVQRDNRFGGMHYLNPGAAGHAGMHLVRTLLKFKLDDGQLSNFQVVELGPRGRKADASFE